MRIVVVFKHTNAKLLVEQPNLLEHFSSHCHAEHCQHVDWKDLTIVLLDEAGGPGRHIFELDVVNLNLSLIANCVGHRSDQTDRRVAMQMANQSRNPTASNHSVVIQQDQVISCRMM